MLFFAVILYIFLDGVYQFAIFIRECVGSAFAQYVIIRFGDTDVERAFSGFGGYILTIVKLIFSLTTSFTFLAVLPRLLVAWMLMFVASS